MKDDERKNVRLPLMVTESEAAAIDEWRYANKLPSRAEAIRLLIAAGLKGETIPVRSTKPAPPGGTGDDKPGSARTSGGRSPQVSKPTPKAAPVSKEAQLRAMREVSAG